MTDAAPTDREWALLRDWRRRGPDVAILALYVPDAEWSAQCQAAGRHGRPLPLGVATRGVQQALSLLGLALAEAEAGETDGPARRGLAEWMEVEP